MYVSAQYQDPDTAYIVIPVSKDAPPTRDIEDVREEAEGLAHAINLNVINTRIVNYSKIHAGSFFGKGTRVPTLSKPVIKQLTRVRNKKMQKC